MKVIKDFFKQKETYVGIAVAILFQIIFFTIWLTAYNGVFDRTDQLDVAIVNEDHQVGMNIAKEIKENAPFKVKDVANLKEAKADLDDRKYQMVIEIPDVLTENMQQAKPSELKFYINQSTSTLSRQIMESAAATITNQINEQVAAKMNDEVSNQVTQGMVSQAENPEVAEVFAKTLIEQIEKASEENPIQASIIKVHEVDGFTATMVPLLVVLASFVGAMLMSQQLEFASLKLATKRNAWSRFGARQVINLIIAVVISILTICLMAIFDLHLQNGVLETWAFQSLLFFSFLSLSQVFVLLLGNAGMVFNIIFMSTQLVTSGVIVPKAMLSAFYQRIGDFLPATYGANGYFSIVYGGGDLASDFKHLAIILVCSLCLALCSVFIKTKMISKNRAI